MYTKINESFVLFENLSDDQIKKLTIKKDTRFNIWAQMNPKYAYEYFYRRVDNGFVVPTGLLEYLDIEQKPIRSDKLDLQLDAIIEKLQPFPVYDYQKQAIKDAIQFKRLFIKAATGAGKSVIIGLIVKILTLQNLKGLILVPNISLTKQFDNDLNDYKLNIETRLIGGKQNIKKFDNPLTISTWQSVMRFKDALKELDFIIVDEAHSSKSDQIFDIVTKCVNAKYKIGLTGTIPKDEIDQLRIKASFGDPITYITPRGLIDRGLATEAEVNLIRIKYSRHFAQEFEGIFEYSAQLKKIKQISARNFFLAKLAIQSSARGNTLMLFQHTEHGLQLFYNVLKQKNIPYNEKTYKDLILQRDNNIFFINGMISGEQREIIRQLIENVQNAIIVANYSTTSTGVNIKNLHNLILASPLKSYVTITQSIGRILRTHKTKDIVRVYDIADDIGFFKKQIKARIEDSYAPEGYTIKEHILNI